MVSVTGLVDWHIAAIVAVLLPADSLVWSAPEANGHRWHHQRSKFTVNEELSYITLQHTAPGAASLTFAIQRPTTTAAVPRAECYRAKTWLCIGIDMGQHMSTTSAVQKYAWQSLFPRKRACFNLLSGPEKCIDVECSLEELIESQTILQYHWQKKYQLSWKRAAHSGGWGWGGVVLCDSDQWFSVTGSQQFDTTFRSNFSQHLYACSEVEIRLWECKSYLTVLNACKKKEAISTSEKYTIKMYCSYMQFHFSCSLPWLSYPTTENIITLWAYHSSVTLLSCF